MKALHIKAVKTTFRTLALLAAATCLPSFASDTYRPATFGAAQAQLENRLSLPASLLESKSTIAVYCQADVPVTGVITETQCFEMTESGLGDQTLEALRGVAFSPAEVNGTAVPVRIQFRVVLSASGTQPSVLLLPNLGTLQGQHGVDYFAPQERLDSTAWYESYRESQVGSGKAFFERGRLTRVIASISTSGEVASVSTLDARGASGKRDAAAMEKALKSSRFIPGFVRDHATEMHYVAVLNYAK